MNFAPSTFGAGSKTRLEFRISNFNPHFVYRPVASTLRKAWQVKGRHTLALLALSAALQGQQRTTARSAKAVQLLTQQQQREREQEIHGHSKATKGTATMQALHRQA